MPTMFFPVLCLLATWVQLVDARCSALKENCNVTRCCQDKKLTCYEKNAEFADCRASCKKGFHDDDKGQWHTPWSCRKLNRGGCSAVKENCNMTKCCQDSALTCYEKNAEFADCRPSCKPGIHPKDAAQWRTPWSCKVLKGVPITSMGSGSMFSSGGEKCGAAFSKCGGQNYKGTTCCQPGCVCKSFGTYYSSCRPASGHGHACGPNQIADDDGNDGKKKKILVLSANDELHAEKQYFDGLPRMGQVISSQVAIVAVVISALVGSIVFVLRRRNQRPYERRDLDLTSELQQLQFD